MTLTCARCPHTWAIELDTVPKEVQERIPDGLNDR
jgi:hypothetical protein